MIPKGVTHPPFCLRVAMTERITIAESRFHKLKGDFPEVPTYPHVDTDLLYQGDPDPFHIVLPIAEIGRISKNGLEYDTALVSAIAEQLQSGVGGIRGHIPDDSLSTAYPLDAVLWIGHSQQGDTLYAKGYIPPGDNREDIRRKKAVGGTVGTSIFGNAIKETSQTKKRSTWRAKEFKLEQVDLAPSQRAALENQRGFLITREMQEGEDMPDIREITSAADVPQAIREQIIAESEAGKKLARVSEMETRISELETQLAEQAQYKSIVAEIRTTLGANSDIPTLVAEYYNAVSKLTTMLGVQDVASISVRVEEMQTVVAEYAQKAFEGAVDTKVAELTSKLDAKTDAGKAKVAAFRKTLRSAVVAQLGGEKSTEKIAEIGDKVWGDGFELISQSIVAELVGPAALVGGRDNPKPEGSGSSKISDEELKKNAQQYAHTKN